ncbi:protein amalgam [Lepeophtheirus salmonis]|uniref:protein amalgam n=1 Tax=Lepeophtheirus salmonis TaxID=72036 RepID=UPI001AE50A7E|nr:zwei Ig domain protein zig-8-like isoform X2 [Lepeophtheirus salmonis]
MLFCTKGRIQNFFYILNFFYLIALGSPHNTRRGHGMFGPRGSHKGSYGPPFFEINKAAGGRNITTVEGGKVTLICTVQNLDINRTVSWIRKARHPIVLSSGAIPFTSDPRVSVSHPKGSSSWILVLERVQRKDNGLYECQVNTEDKMSLVFLINVLPAKARLFGESDVYVKAGSTISLTCSINLYSVPPPDVTWFHDQNILNFDSPRGGISLETEKSRTGTMSKLLVTRATLSDSGNYTCKPSRGEEVTANVHVIKREHQAGLQDGQTGEASQISNSITSFFFLLIYSHQQYLLQ